MGNVTAECVLMLWRRGRAPIVGPRLIAHGDSWDDTFPALEFPLGGHPSLWFDYDGDGQKEVGMYEVTTHHSRGPEVQLSVWTLRGSSVQRYQPARPFNAVGVTDADEDGRPDLLLDSRDSDLCPDGKPLTDTCPPTYHSSLHPDQLAHSLPDGRFSTSDSVAKSFKPDPW